MGKLKKIEINRDRHWEDVPIRVCGWIIDLYGTARRILRRGWNNG